MGLKYRCDQPAGNVRFAVSTSNAIDDDDEDEDGGARGDEKRLRERERRLLLGRGLAVPRRREQVGRPRVARGLNGG